MNSKIRPALPSDAKNICDIYNYYVEHTVISFEDVLVTEAEMEERITNVSSQYPWIVYETDGVIQAYAYAGKWKTRSAYRFVLECTIYARHDLTEKGVGTKLYEQLFSELDGRFVRSVMAIIALPNDASIGLHEKFGFEKVAHFKDVGYKHDEWIDVGYWQKTFE